MVALLLLTYRCIVTMYVLWLFLTVPWVGLQCVIVVFPDHTRLRFDLAFLYILDWMSTVENIAFSFIYLSLSTAWTCWSTVLEK